MLYFFYEKSCSRQKKNHKMATVIRVKRRIDEEPLNAFVLNCKKRKLLQETTPSSNLLENDTEVSQILKFAGTVESHVSSFVNERSVDPN